MNQATVWTGDGSAEPPARVTKVRDAAGRVAERAGERWTYTHRPDREGEPTGHRWSWQNTGMQIDGPYVEVAE